MPEIPAEAVPPSIEHLIHEITKWADSPIGSRVMATGVPAQLADSMGRHCPDVDQRMLGEVLIRLASHLTQQAKDIPDMPPWMLVNLIGAAGADLIATGDDHA